MFKRSVHAQLKCAHALLKYICSRWLYACCTVCMHQPPKLFLEHSVTWKSLAGNNLKRSLPKCLFDWFSREIWNWQSLVSKNLKFRKENLGTMRSILGTFLVLFLPTSWLARSMCNKFFYKLALLGCSVRECSSILISLGSLAENKKGYSYLKLRTFSYFM